MFSLRTEEDTLAFIATTGWSVAIKTADLAGDWLAVSPLTGNKGDNELIITLASNPLPRIEKVK